MAAVWTVLSLAKDGLDPNGKALGTDFTSFWAAARLALSGHPAWVYDPALHYEVQSAAFAGVQIPYAAFFYPPPYLLVCLPLGLVPYLAALGLWLLLTGAVCWLVLRALGGPVIGSVALLAYPAVWINMGHGQNAFLTTALLGSGILLLSQRPGLAGAAFGALVVKPQLGVALPILVLAGGRWRTLLGAVLSATLLCLAATWSFGVDIWRAYWPTMAAAREAAEQNLVGYAKFQSVFSSARLVGLPLEAAYALQFVAAALAALVLVWLVRRNSDPIVTGPAIVLVTLLTTPFLLDYDLMLLSIPLACMTRAGVERGFLPWEKSLLAAAYLLPLVARPIATAVALPLTPAVAIALLALIVRREHGSSTARDWRDRPAREAP